MKYTLVYIDKAIKGAVATSIFLIMAIICVQVFFRFVLNSALPWPEEASRFLMIWALFIGGAYAFLENEHASITFLSKRFPYKLSIVVNVFNNLVIIFFLSVIIYGGYQQMDRLGGLTTGAMGISRAIPYAAIPVSCILYVLFAFRLILINLNRDN